MSSAMKRLGAVSQPQRHAGMRRTGRRIRSLRDKVALTAGVGDASHLQRSDGQAGALALSLQYQSSCSACG